jgi:antirestriction protein ArdC
VTPTVRQDHAEYIGSWLKALRSDKKYLLDAAMLAGEAIDFMDAQQTKTTKAAA